MGLGVVQFVLTRRYLGTSGAYTPSTPARAKQWRYLWATVGLGALALTAQEVLAPVTREQRRSRRKRAIRARTISVKRMTKRELELGRLLYPEGEDGERPEVREDCASGARPCPFVFACLLAL